MDDSIRISFLKQAETGAITDAMCLIGVGGWLDEGILPASNELKLSGRAFTLQYSIPRDPNQKTYNIFEALDMCEAGDVVVVSAPTSMSNVGENIMSRLVLKGLAGMILDGYLRDMPVIKQNKLPIFSRGASIHVSSVHKITAVQVPVLCGGVIVEPGDYITADMDGVIALPQKRIDDVIFQAEHVAQVESELEAAIKGGLPTTEVIGVSQKKRTPRAE